MNTVLTYKGYHAVVNYDADDQLLVGEVIGIDDSLSFHASSGKDIEKEFHNSIDNYLALCKKIRKHPEKEYSGRFSVRISPESHKKIYLTAESKGISLSKAIEDAIAHYAIETY